MNSTRRGLIKVNADQKYRPPPFDPGHRTKSHVLFFSFSFSVMPNIMMFKLEVKYRWITKKTMTTAMPY